MDNLLYSSHINIYSTTEAPSITFVLNYVSAFTPISTNTTISKLQRLCKICGLNFKESLISKTSNKKVCQFCFEAVCDSCSSLKVSSATNDKKSRICIGCLNASIGKYFKRIRANSTTERSETEEATKQDSEYLETLKDLIDLRKSELLEKERDAKKVLLEYDKFEAPQVNKDENLRLKKELKDEEEELGKLNKLLEKRNTEVETLNGRLEDLQEVKHEKIVMKKSLSLVAPSLDVVRDQIHLLSGLRNSYTHDIRRLRGEEKEAENESCSCF